MNGNSNSNTNSNQTHRKTVEFRRSELNDSKYSDRLDGVVDRIIYRFKVILLGDIAVGKTSILSRFVDNKFTNEYKCNVGVEYKVKSLFLDESTGADLQIWDTCGEERFRTLTRQYYRDAYGVVLIFDLTNRSSYDKLKSWIDDIKEYAGDETTVFIIGNKSDLADDRKVDFGNASEFAAFYNLNYYEVSAKTGNNVSLLFENLTAFMVKKESDKDKTRRKKGKIDKSNVSTNKNVIFEKSMKLEKLKNKKSSTCC